MIALTHVRRALTTIFVVHLYTAAAPTPSVAQPVVTVIDTFTNCIDPKTHLPCGWRASKENVSMFFLRREKGNYFIRDSVYDAATTIGKIVSIDLTATPFLHWRWRVHSLPKGGNESIKGKADSGAGVYVIFAGYFLLNRIIKYAWSTTLPVGTITKSPYFSNVAVTILRSGSDGLGVWIGQTVNIFEDYKAIFHSTPPKVEGIAIMSDSDDTKSFAEADYDDFWVSKSR